MILHPQFKDGVRFECQGSGKCCMSRGSYGYVYLSADDRKKMAQELAIPVRTFTRRYCDQTRGLYHLKNPEKDCVFLEGSRCAVYAGRPTQCRTWPFWPENMNPRVWNKEVAPFCPGVGKGKLHTSEEIKHALALHASQDPSLPTVKA